MRETKVGSTSANRTRKGRCSTATVLYITAHPLSHTQSYSLQVGKAFLDSYREAAPDDTITHLDLYKLDIPQIDADIFSGWGKLRSGTAFDQLSDVEKRKIGRLNEISDQFVAADKWVFVTPFWNFSFPPVMKAYIDAVCVAGKTFKYTEQGPVGLMTEKKGLHIQASGGVYSTGPMADWEFGHRYLATIMQFFGVPSFEGLFVEGHNAQPDRAEEILAEAIMRTPEVAKRFAAPVRVPVHAQ